MENRTIKFRFLAAVIKCKNKLDKYAFPENNVLGMF